MVPHGALQEEDLQTLRRQPINCVRFSNGPGTDVPERYEAPSHWHKQAEIVLILKGVYEAEINLKKYMVYEGDICIFNSGDLHRLSGVSETTSHAVMLFDPEILDFAYEDEWEKSYIEPFIAQRMCFVNVLRADSVPKVVRESLLRLFEAAEQKQENWYVNCKLLLLLIFHQLVLAHFLVSRKETDADSRKVRRFKKLVSYIEGHYAEPIGLQQLSEVVSCNSQYLCRSFKTIAGMSPTQYIIDYRIEQACRLLEDMSKPLAEISAECGFDNVSYFIRKFKEKKGCTPGQYRGNVQTSQ